MASKRGRRRPSNINVLRGRRLLGGLGDKETQQYYYSISGPDLGWEEGLTKGKSTYYRDRGEIIPAAARSEALKEILAGGLDSSPLQACCHCYLRYT